ncbi:MAG: universal stress protein [Deltaproteobacteria bacterium]|nr:universal stress protein [Deltaproteobacteria bacterium]
MDGSAYSLKAVETACGLAGKTRSFLGSTASQVVIYSPCSVLVVKTQD